ncbi:MAG: hypothetical protein ABS46_20290 [Cytophagaceae bacterium SCN 52-12]|nr:MAG: hypothetical protein ABS46_20290 [Cytophagaceae bacterium SCN 52-12]
MPDFFKKIKNSIAVVFDNHQLFADSFGKMIENLRIFRDVHSFSNETDLIHYLINFPSDTTGYFFLDYYLEEKTALTLIADVKRMCRSSRIIIVSVVTSPALIRSLAAHPKVDGIISKYSGSPEVIDCIREVAGGGKYLAGYLQGILAQNAGLEQMPFTDRELEILQMASQGLTVDITAERLNISRHTVAAHRRKILAKANCNSVAELVVLARKWKWI